MYSSEACPSCILPVVEGDDALDEKRKQLPSPTILPGKEVPYTTFASKIFPEEGAVTSHTIHLDRSNAMDLHDKGIEDVVSNILYADSEDDSEDEDATLSEESLHLPAGQHLLVDIKNVDPEFLNSEDRLAAAMVELIQVSKLTLLSYHCHSLVPVGVSCAGVLLESHVAFHTWPKEGVIAMDLFTCGAEPLIPVVPMIEQMFAIPSEVEEGGVRTEPSVVWSHKLRGFRQGFSPDYKSYENPLEADLGNDLAAHEMDMRVPLVDEETDFQHVAIYQMIDSRKRSLAAYEKSISNDGSYESLHPEMFLPDKILWLDGVEQSSLMGDAAYHEALVHPAMIAHPNPKRAAIIGGGEGATLRELLKHKSLENAVMVEIDEDLVGLCEEYLPEWNSCDDIEGSDADSCFDDSRSTVVFQDAFKWFIDRFGRDATIVEDKFDVIIMDALDPDKMVEIVGNLYKDDTFTSSIFNALSEDGVFVVQLGQTDSLSDPAPETGSGKDKANMMQALKQVGFQSMHVYDEGHSHFDDPWSYLVCFKDSTSRANWYRSSAEIEIELHQRMYGSKSGRSSSLRFFDGSTMAGYQVPTRAQETIYCRSENAPWECDEYLGINPEFVTIPISHLEAQKSKVSEHAGRGLFAAQDIPAYSMLDIDLAVKSFHVPPSTWSVMENLHDWADENEKFHGVEDELSSMVTFTDGYGYCATVLGKKHFTVDSGISTFCNHGCNGTWTIGDEDDYFTELNVDLNEPPKDFLNHEYVYSPVFERHLRQIMSVGSYTLRDIKAGEEILCNYLSFVGDAADWEGDVTDLRAQCTGSMGDIQEYEVESISSN